MLHVVRVARPGLYLALALLLVNIAETDSGPWWLGAGVAIAGLITWLAALLDRRFQSRRYSPSQVWPLVAVLVLAIGLFANEPGLIWMWLGMFLVAVLERLVTGLLGTSKDHT